MRAKGLGPSLKVEDWDVGPGPFQKEKSLLLEVLKMALRDATSVGSSKYKAQARDWFMSDRQNGEDKYFTFLEVCDHLNIQPGPIRNLIQRNPKSLRHQTRHIYSLPKGGA